MFVSFSLNRSHIASTRGPLLLAVPSVLVLLGMCSRCLTLGSLTLCFSQSLDVLADDASKYFVACLVRSPDRYHLPFEKGLAEIPCAFLDC
jgi:hypothetical protein